MNKKGFILLGGIGVIIILLFVRAGGGQDNSNKIINDEVSMGKIKVAHVFAGGMHTFTGEINLPTPCHILVHKIVIAESYPEQVTIAFDTKSEVDACVQMVTPEPFVASFEASEEADIRITLGGKDIPFEVIEGQLLEDEADSPVGEGGEDNATSTTEGEVAIVEKIDFYSCIQDSDCVSVKEDCCGCTAGGSATAINKDLESEWQKKLNCTEIMCTTVMSNHPSCFQEPKCAEEKCILADTME